MKILAIRIKNLASLEGITEIDFTAEPLCSAGIFAITGATGAGKSTILDALCLALYGKTPRYLQAKEIGIEIKDVQGSAMSQGDVRSILRDGTADGFAEVDFKGVDGANYTATWSVRRARNRADGSMQSDTITLKNSSSNQDIAGRKTEILKEIERLVGLNFEQFTRSVLLAQGDFTAFMKASKDEKSSLLEKLTGTHIYSEISKKIFERYKVEEQHLRDFNIQKQSVAIFDAQERQSLLDQHAALEKQISFLELEIATVATEMNWHEQLVNLQISHNESDAALEKVVEIKKENLPRRQKLVLTEQVQHTRVWADAVKIGQQTHAEKTTSLVKLKEAIHSHHDQKEALENQFLAAAIAVTKTNAALSEALPLLEKARKLDTMLSERKEQLLQANQEIETVSKKNAEHQNLLADRQTSLANLCLQIQTAEDWNLENTDRRPIAENKELILSKLKDGQKHLKISLSSAAAIALLDDKIKANQQVKATLETDLSQQATAWERANKNYDVEATALLLVPIEILILDKSDIDREVENTIRAQANWQLLFNNLTELQTLTQQQVADQTTNKTKSASLLQMAQQLVIQGAQKETADRILQKVQLASAENVETLRKNLQDKEPCPVCGSTAHPYALHNPQLDYVVADLKKNYQEMEVLYMTTFRQQNALEQECKSLQITIQNQSEAIQNRKNNLDEQRKLWEEFDIAKEVSSLAENKRADFIELKLVALKTRQAELQSNIQNFNNQKKELETAKIKLDNLKEIVDQHTVQVKEIDAAIGLAEEQRKNRVTENTKANSDLAKVTHELSDYFIASDWMEKWKADPQTFLESIDAFSKKWKENNEKLAQHMNQKVGLEATVKELEGQAKVNLEDFTKKKALYAAQDKNFLDLKKERNGIFDGNSAEAMEQQLKNSANEALQIQEQIKASQQQLQLNITKAETQKEELLKSLQALEADINFASQKWQDWIIEYNRKNNQSLEMTTIAALLLLGMDWITAERNALQKIDEEVVKANSVLIERKEHLEAHRQKSISERPLDQLNSIFAAAKLQSEQHKQAKGDIGFQLQQDDRNKLKMGSMLEKITIQAEITENWSKLNEIIGSADGKKFRQIAQEYTLDALLGYANIHLEALTSRYRIERIPATLGLQVVDQDMGDEVRTVYSLSGGESFLVSLALALGLASLSTSRMKVESLFIDEGFGSLDPQTLNIAMDALERLHNQGRKVGVISHVQEMTERIAVQIRVSKQQSGKSLVEVVGN